MQEDLLRVLNEIEDPELGIGIVDVGLIYRADWTETGIEVDVTATTPACPFGTSLCEQIDKCLHRHFGEASSIRVRLVWDPPWSLDRLSENGRRALGWSSQSKVRGNNVSVAPASGVGLRKH
jgi:metal-sulfur cluster biosynthetic enzyme